MQELIKYCQTDRQRQVIEAIIECGSQRKACGRAMTKLFFNQKEITK